MITPSQHLCFLIEPPVLTYNYTSVASILSSNCICIASTNYSIAHKKGVRIELIDDFLSQYRQSIVFLPFHENMSTFKLKRHLLTWPYCPTLHCHQRYNNLEVSYPFESHAILSQCTFFLHIQSLNQVNRGRETRIVLVTSQRELNIQDG